MSFYRKYRPQTFADLIGEDHIRDTLSSASKQKHFSHAYLLTGPRGTGKTTVARLIAKAVNCNNLQKDGEPCNECESCNAITAGRAIDVIEIDAASNRGIDEIRELRENVKFTPQILPKKVFIIDEVHMLTREAFNALLKTLEEPPDHALFILATTEIHKVPATIISRTQRFDFHRVSKKSIISNLKKIAEAEKITIDEKSLDLIATVAEGGHRDAIGLLDQIAGKSKTIDVAATEEILGLAKFSDAFSLLEAIFNFNPEEGLKIAHRVFDAGGSMNLLASASIEILRKILLYTFAGEVLFDETAENSEKIAAASKDLTAKKVDGAASYLISLIEIFVEATKLMKDVAYPVLPIEMAIIDATLDGKKMIEDRVPTPALGGVGIPTESVGKDLVTNKMEEKEEIKQKPMPAAETKPAGDAAPLVEAEGIDWAAVVEKTKLENNSLAALLRDAKPLGLDGDTIVIGVKFPFHKEKISETKNIEILETIIENTLGHKYILKCQIADLKKKNSNPLSDEDLEKTAKEVFG